MIPDKPSRSTIQEPDCHMGIKDEVQKSSVRGISNYFHSASSESPSKEVHISRSDSSSSSSNTKVKENKVEDRKSEHGCDKDDTERLSDFKRQKVEIATKKDTNVDQSFASNLATSIEKHVESVKNVDDDEVEIVLIRSEEEAEENTFICQCPLCGRNITALSASDRNSHVDRCCNSESKSSTPKREPKKNITSKSKSSDAKKVRHGSIQNYFLSTPP